MKRKLLGPILSLVFLSATYASDLVIDSVHSFYLPSATEEVSRDVDSLTITVSVLLKNTGKEDIEVVTGSIGPGASSVLDGDLTIAFRYVQHSRRGIPIVPSRSSFDTVILRPNEATDLNYTSSFPLDRISKDVYVRYEIDDSLKSRFGVWCGILSTKSIRVGADPQKARKKPHEEKGQK